ncbi:MAG: hypothetical protein EAZ80_14005, partial [Runella slithyformis]
MEKLIHHLEIENEKHSMLERQNFPFIFNAKFSLSSCCKTFKKLSGILHRKGMKSATLEEMEQTISEA